MNYQSEIPVRVEYGGRTCRTTLDEFFKEQTRQATETNEWVGDHSQEVENRISARQLLEMLPGKAAVLDSLKCAPEYGAIVRVPCDDKNIDVESYTKPFGNGSHGIHAILSDAAFERLGKPAKLVVEAQSGAYGSGGIRVFPFPMTGATGQKNPIEIYAGTFIYWD